MLSLADCAPRPHRRITGASPYCGTADALPAAGFAVIMVGALVTTHLPHGFFMNWSGKQAGEGYEYHLLVIGISLALLITGAGKWSVDKVVAEKIR